MQPSLPALLVLLGLLAAPAALAEHVRVEPEGGVVFETPARLDKPVVGRFTVRAEPDDFANLTVRPRGLVREDGREVLGPAHVEVVPNESARRLGLQDYTVTLRDIRSPGRYEGSIDLVLLGHTPEGDVRLSFTVEVNATPSLVFVQGDGPIRIDAARCGGTCWIAQTIFPYDARDNHTLKYRNPTAGEVAVLRQDLVLSRENSSSELGGNAFVLTGVSPAPPQGFYSLLLALNRSEIPPGRYEGTVYLTLEGDVQVQSPIVINVRAAPTWPFGAILLGLAVGFAVRYAKDKGARHRAALREVAFLRRRQERLGAVGKKAADRELDDFIQDALSGRVPDLDARRLVAEDRLGTLETLEDAHAELERKDLGQTLAAAFESRLAAVWDMVEARDWKRAATEATALRDEIRRGGAPAPTRAASRSTLAFAVPEERVIEAQGRRGRLARAGRWLWGNRAEAAAGAVRLALRLVHVFVLILLALVGYHALYLPNSTFGATAADWVGLIAWGFGSELTVGTLREAVKT